MATSRAELLDTIEPAAFLSHLCFDNAKLITDTHKHIDINLSHGLYSNHHLIDMGT